MTLQEIQQKLKAPKSQYNNFSKYHYRSMEDILEAVKPLLEDNVLLLSDEIVNIGGHNYIKATARLIEGEKTIEVSAYAKEATEQKGMAAAQITGSTSSYARKYALNGLFLIDDTKDDDFPVPTQTKPQIRQQAKDLLKVKVFKDGAKKPEDIPNIILNKAGVKIESWNKLDEATAKTILELYT